MKILVVDDKADHLYMLETLLKNGGYEVVSAVNGAEAIENLHSEGADMIISDILMPVMDGFQLCREVRADDTLKYIPFIFYTATYTDEKDEEFALKIGADKFLRKPMEPDEFMKILRGVIRDVKEGKLRPQDLALGKTEETFELYSERLVKKLEKKMLDLEKEITERKHAEVRIEHLISVLRAIRGVNQLIVREKDRDRLLQGVCDTLIENRVYYNAWIALLDDTGCLEATAQAGLGKDFLPIVERLKKGKMTDCVKKAQMQQGIVVTKDPPSTCTNCPLAKRYRGRGGFSVRLEHGGKMYGLLTASIPGDFAADGEEQSLFGEVAGDVGYALHNMELEKEQKKAEKEIRRMGEEWMLTFDSITNWVSIQDKDFKIVRVNRAYADNFDMKPEELIGKPCYELIHGTKEPWPSCPHRQTLETKKPAINEFFEPRLGIYLEITCSPIFNENGEVTGSVHITKDITEHKQAEEELEKHREHLEEMVQKRTAELTKANQHLKQQIEERERAEEALRESENSLAEAQRVAHMGNWDLDLVKNKLRWSDEIYRIFGLKPQEFGATYEAFLNTIHPDDREFVDTSYTKSVKSNTPYDIVHRIVRSDGELLWVHEKAEDIKDETGKTIRSIGTVQDITERKRAEEDLQKEVSTRKKTEEELQNNIQTLERFRKMAVGREKQMIKLKEEINELLINQGREKKYKNVG